MRSGGPKRGSKGGRERTGGPTKLPKWFRRATLGLACESKHGHAMTRTLLLVLILIANEALAQQGTGYAGRYAADDTFLIYVAERDSSVTLRPVFWTSVQPLRFAGPDSFVVDDRPDRSVRFRRDEGGRISGLFLTNIGSGGFYRKYASDEAHPAELLFNGEPDGAIGMLREKGHKLPEIIELGNQLLRFSPSEPGTAARYFSILADLYSDSSSVHSRLGAALVAFGPKGRLQAPTELRRALSLDPSNREARAALFRIGLVEDTTGWKLPFRLKDLFAPPTPDEIREVKESWRVRDLSPNNVQVVSTGRMNLGFSSATVRIIAHTVHGSRHYGAVIVPEGRGSEKKGIILEAKGVSWDYFPLDINHGVLSPRILGPDQSRFIYLVPSFRGERMIVDGREFLSEGDRTDNWDGATDDALAFLDAALTITPEADTSRIAVFGKSRGGSIALLAGIRQPRIKRVVDWVGPIDWFEAMGTEGWSQHELVKDGLRLRSRPDGVAGQFIERFLLKGIRGERGLKETRLHMIASSPLYFIRDLPMTQAHYGVKDGMVPVRNAKEFQKAMGAASRKDGIFLYEQSGHDLDNDLSVKRSAEFLMKMMEQAVEKK